MTGKIVISASRRTDIPAFYMDAFMAGIARGAFHVKNPFNRRVSVVPATPDKVHTIVFWSKNFGPFLDGGYGLELARMGYNLFFLFTVNAESPLLEPNLPPVEERIQQARALAGSFGAESLWWRFDPICFYDCGNGVVRNNMAGFDVIAGQMAGFGIQRCITSFVDIYAKVTRRVRTIPGFSLIDPPLAQKAGVVRSMADLLEPMGISLYTCCENELTAALPEDCGIKAGGCISNRFLQDLFGGKVSFARDAGQRRDKGCQCTVSRDIGCYEDHPCGHGCLYCYAGG